MPVALYLLSSDKCGEPAQSYGASAGKPGLRASALTPFPKAMAQKDPDTAQSRSAAR
jgi:hypothetical protein